mmetsp:Transcript_29201/g.83824  ORF Transcript_29201/g.83824 Transcript_29201/m.83824 type:complete len:259 (-) Transcript_29201:1446-2222(-)
MVLARLPLGGHRLAKHRCDVSQRFDHESGGEDGQNGEGGESVEASGGAEDDAGGALASRLVRFHGPELVRELAGRAPVGRDVFWHPLAHPPRGLHVVHDRDNRPQRHRRAMDLGVASGRRPPGVVVHRRTEPVPVHDGIPLGDGADDSRRHGDYLEEHFGAELQHLMLGAGAALRKHLDLGLVGDDGRPADVAPRAVPPPAQLAAVPARARHQRDARDAQPAAGGRAPRRAEQDQQGRRLRIAGAESRLAEAVACRDL